VSDLKQTAYRPATAILAAKKHYCVNDGVCMSESKSVDEGCDSLRESSQGCKFDAGARGLASHVQKRSDLQVLHPFPSCDCLISSLWCARSELGSKSHMHHLRDCDWIESIGRIGGAWAAQGLHKGDVWAAHRRGNGGARAAQGQRMGGARAAHRRRKGGACLALHFDIPLPSVGGFTAVAWCTTRFAGWFRVFK
jgi:hypothetical protein